MMISAPDEGVFASHPSIEDRIDALVTYAATHLNGLRLAPASTRYLPPSSTATSQSGFSITAMRYPSWISKPIIVLPALSAAAVAYSFRENGLQKTFVNTISFPGSVVEQVGASDAGEVIYVLKLIIVCVVINIVSRLLIKAGFDYDFLRTLSGGPSKHMQSDWDEPQSATETKLNAAMTQRIASYNAASATPAPIPAPANLHPLAPGAPQRSFGRAAPKA
jgi:hypothetical protein